MGVGVSLYEPLQESSAGSQMEMPGVKNVGRCLEKLMEKFLENFLESFLVSSMESCEVRTLMRI